MARKPGYNDKARAGSIAKDLALRNARKHGRHLPPGEEPKSKRQKQKDKYTETKLRTDEKIRLMNILGKRPKVQGMEGAKVLKRPKSQDPKQVYETFEGFDSDDQRSEDSESSVEDISRPASGATQKPSAGSPNFGFEVPVKQRKVKIRSRLKYNWRAKLEQSKKRKAEDDIELDADTESDPDSSNTDASHSSAHEAEIAKKRSSFKEWAAMQVDKDEAQPVSNLSAHNPDFEHYVSRPRSVTPEVQDTSDLQAPALSPVIVQRDAKIEELRFRLPAYAKEQELVEAIKTHSTVIITGATGSGKTTQVPQFLYEAGFKGIGITQPRRVAAVSMARRIAVELGDSGSKVGYQIRFDSTVKAGTEIKLMTDGVLLRELSQDFLLSKYHVLIIDEAHERSVNTDILIGVLSRVIKLRKDTGSPLRLVIMSATLRVSDFADNARLFARPPPVMSIEARQFPVTNHFSKRTEMSSYVQEAFKKICKIHEKLPPGGILVFLTGQQEIQQCQQLLKDHFGKNYNRTEEEQSERAIRVKADEQYIETEDYEASDRATKVVYEPESESDSDLSDIEETEEDKARPADLKKQKFVRVLPLYSLLPTTDQMKVFTDTAPQTRKIVLATNVAETSLTIPDIRYVVDSGRAKVRKLQRNVQSFQIDWISKASSDQRSGRAGRTGPGHAYRLFSSAVFDAAFPDFADAEILNVPIDGIVLQMKGMNIHTVTNFPFPTPPNRDALADAERLLINLGALDVAGKISRLGSQMSLFPLSPRFAKMLILGDQGGMLAYIVAIVAALSIDDPFLREAALQDDVPEEETEERNRRRQAYFRAMGKFSNLDASSDVMRTLMAVCAADYASDLASFCEENFLRLKAMEEIRKLRAQITNVIRSITDIPIDSSLRLKPPSLKQVELIHKVLGSAFLDQICIRADLATTQSVNVREVLRVPYVPLKPLEYGQQFAYVHPSSLSIQRGSAGAPPEYLLYSTLSSSSNNPEKTRIKVLCPIKASWIHDFAKGSPLITYGKPLLQLNRQIEILEGGKARLVPVIPTVHLHGSGSRGWELPPVKIKQNLHGPRWVNS